MKISRNLDNTREIFKCISNTIIIIIIMSGLHY